MNHILSFRPTHPVALLIEPYIKMYRTQPKLLNFRHFIIEEIFYNDLCCHMYTDLNGKIRTHHEHERGVRYAEYRAQYDREYEHDHRNDTDDIDF
jgi:hypothetical protein